jgi:hypothetical protein
MQRISLVDDQTERVNGRSAFSVRRWIKPALTGSALLLALLIVACGSSADADPTTTAPPPTSTAPESTATAATKPLQATFADGRFTVNYLYRSDPALTAAIEVVDVDSVLTSSLSQIGALLPEGNFTINFKDTMPFQYRDGSLPGLTDAQIERLVERGFVPWMTGGVIEVLIDPNGPTAMEDIWRDIIPIEIAAMTYLSVREAGGQPIENVLDTIVSDGLAMQFQKEVFPGPDGGERKYLPEFAELEANMSIEQEREVWAAALPELDEFPFSSVNKRIYEGFPFGIRAAIGFRIIEAYLANHPDATASSLIGVSSEEILEVSSYNP